MDSQHKHELKENDLQQFLAHFGEWWGKHQTKVLIAAILIAGTILAVRVMKNNAIQEHDSTYFGLNLETSPAGFKAIAADAGDDNVRAIASLRAADLLMQEAAMPAAGDDNDPTDDERKAKLEEARQLYSQADSAAEHMLFKLNARMGLAAVAESLGNWEEAVKVYETVKADAAETYPRFAAEAGTRISLLPRVKTPPVFAPEPKPEPTKDGASKDSPTKDGVSKDTATKDGATKDGASKDAATKDAATKDAATKDAASKDTATKDAAAKDGASNNTPTKDAANKDAKSK